METKQETASSSAETGPDEDDAAGQDGAIEETLRRPRSIGPDQSLPEDDIVVPSVLDTPRRRRAVARVSGWMVGHAVRGGERIGTILRYPPENRFLPRLAIASAIILLSLYTNRSFLGWGLFVTIAVLFVPIGRARSFTVSFVPYAGVWFIFSALRSLADETILAQTLNLHVSRLERWLFGGQLPTLLLQDRFFDPSHLRWHDYFLTGIHWSYFLVPHAVAVRLWQKHPAAFRQHLSGMMLLLAVGLGIYFVIPSNPPWLAPDPVNSPAAARVIRIMEPVGDALGGGLYSASYKVIGESNPIAAMPSIHMAVTFLLVFGAAAFGPRWRLTAWIYAALMGLALVYLGEHYIVDVAVGMLVATYGWYVAGYWLARVQPVMRARFAKPDATPGGATPGARA